MVLQYYKSSRVGIFKPLGYYRVNWTSGVEVLALYGPNYQIEIVLKSWLVMSKVLNKPLII